MNDETESPASNAISPSNWLLLERYLAGECTDAEQATVAQWVRERPEIASAVSTLRATTERTARMIPTFDQRSGWSQVQPRLTASVPTSVLAPMVRHSADGQTLRRRFQAFGSFTAGASAISLATGAAAVAIVGLMLWHVDRGPNSVQQFRDFATQPGARSTITLRDGTSFVLGPDTHLRVATDFGVRNRSVELDGVAEFNVVPDPARPFTVRTTSAITRDIGTRFVVRAYAQDAETRIAVAEGEVAVAPNVGGGSTAAVHLRAGSIMSFGDGGTPVIHRDVNVASDFAWMQGGLAFEDVPLSDVLRQIARTFDVHITLADSSLSNKRITSVFGPESVEEILDIVTLAVGAHYERVGQTITVRRGVAPVRDKPVPTRPPLNTAEARIRGE